MRAIMISINPKWVAKILNGEKTIEIRKSLPKCDLPIDVYIYCTKAPLKNCSMNDIAFYCMGSGKVVAKFTLYRCEYIYHDFSYPKVQFETDTCVWWKLLEKSCISREQMEDYIGLKKGYAWHIDDLVIFDKPKEISEFSIKVFPNRKDNLMTRYLTRAPQSWCYVEV